MSETFDAPERPDRPSFMPNSSRAAILAALLSAGCGSQGVQQSINEPNTTPSAAMPANWPLPMPPVQASEPNQQEIPPGSMVIVASPPKARPPDSATCVFTGVVLIHDQYSNPHKILLENRCLPNNGGMNYEGQHQWVDADSKDSYKIPFHNAHLEEKPGCSVGQGSCLTFVTGQQGKSVKEDLGYGPEQGSFSFEDSLDAYGIRPIVN